MELETLMIQQSIAFGALASNRELQPYEALMYQQLCRALQSRYRLTDLLYQRAINNESPDTS
jgi:hypothetical protein